MKALTLTQPWASLVVDGLKRLETRSWRTDYRGILAIHAAKSMTADAWDLVQELRDRNVRIDTRQRGMILGIVNLVDCIKITPELAAAQSAYEIDYGDWTPGRFAWLLTDPLRYAEPLPAIGHLSLWETEYAE